MAGAVLLLMSWLMVAVGQPDDRFAVEVEIARVTDVGEAGDLADAAWARDPVSGAESVLVIGSEGAVWFDPVSGARRVVKHGLARAPQGQSQFFKLIERGRGDQGPPIVLDDPNFGNTNVSAWDPVRGKVLWTHTPPGTDIIQFAAPVRDREGKVTVYVKRAGEKMVDQIGLADGALIRRHAIAGDLSMVRRFAELGERGTVCFHAERGHVVIRDVLGTELWRGTPDRDAHFVQAIQVLARKDCLMRLAVWVTEADDFKLSSDTAYYVLNVRDKDGKLAGEFRKFSREDMFRLIGVDAVEVAGPDGKSYWLSWAAGRGRGPEQSFRVVARDGTGIVAGETVVDAGGVRYVGGGWFAVAQAGANEAWLASGDGVYRCRVGKKK